MLCLLNFPHHTHRSAVLTTLSRLPLHPLQDGDKFWRMPECYVRGSTIKYLRIPDEVIDLVKEEVVGKGRGRGDGKGRGGQRGRGQRGGESREVETGWKQGLALVSLWGVVERRYDA